MYKKVITNSLRSTFLDCPYKYFLEYILRLSPRYEPIYFTWGRIVHKAAEARDGSAGIVGALEELRKRAELECAPDKKLQEIEELCKIAPDAADAHLLVYAETDTQYETLGSELKFQLPLEDTDGWVFEGLIDRCVRRITTGTIHNWEIKTAAEVDQYYKDALLLDSQPRGYLLAAQRCYGFDVTSTIYDFWKKPAIKQSKYETREQFIARMSREYLLNRVKYFERFEIAFTQAEIDAYYYDLCQVAQAIQWHWEEGIWPKHHPRNRKGGCVYYPLCRWGLDSGYRDQFIVRGKDEFNPELRKETNVTAI